MGRMRQAWYYERQAKEAQDRVDYFKNKQHPEAATIKTRGASTDLYYRSLIQKAGTTPLIYTVSVPNTTLAKLTAAQAGLKASLADGEATSRLRGSGLHPTKVHWYKGDTTPTRKRTAWNTMVARYYDNTGTQSHYSIPFSKATGAFDANDLKQAFEALFVTNAGLRTNLLGAANGRAYIEWERVSTSAQT